MMAHTKSKEKIYWSKSGRSLWRYGWTGCIWGSKDCCKMHLFLLMAFLILVFFHDMITKIDKTEITWTHEHEGVFSFDKVCNTKNIMGVIQYDSKTIWQ